jgi:general stress protein CsbA
MKGEVMPALLTKSFAKTALDWVVTIAVADLLVGGLKMVWKRFRKTKPVEA